MATTSLCVKEKSDTPERNMGEIKRLEEAVVNRIAAGEVIQRPSNAIKEMIENSLDAGSTSIQVTVKAGGLKMLQIQDNGCGIQKEDLDIVCERFTTSKLKKFEDLSTLNTYGFRGEALASISHVAHVTITTRTASSKCAYRACYSDGRLTAQRPGSTAEPRPCAGNQGTAILVEDLFYNVNTRRKALKSPTEELSRITDMMTKYAVHNSGVSFTLKKHGTPSTEIKTNQGSSVQDNIGLLYGPSVQRELLSITCEDRQFGFKMSGLATNGNYSMKKLCFLLFINNRLVDSSSLRKALELVYSTVLPKGSHPFIYMSVIIKPENIDVNIHPTKHEVHFLHEDKLVEMVQRCVETRLLACDSSRTYYTQALLPSNTGLTSTSAEHASSDKKQDKNQGHESRFGRPYEYNMVRTDARERTLKAFVVPKEALSRQHLPTSPNIAAAAPQNRRKRQALHLTSMLSLQDLIRTRKHSDLTKLFAQHKFVGVVDQTQVLVQYETGLYLLNLHHISKELFYQLVVMDFGNFGSLRLQPPAPIYDMLLLALQSPASGWCPEDGPKEKLAEYALDSLSSKAEMLKEYFSLEIKDGYVVTLPVLLENFVPDLDRLPHFLLCMAVEVDWNTEKNCFHTIAQQCASFYCVQYDPFVQDGGVAYNNNLKEKSLCTTGPNRTMDDSLSCESPETPPYSAVFDTVSCPTHTSTDSPTLNSSTGTSPPTYSSVIVTSSITTATSSSSDPRSSESGTSACNSAVSEPVRGSSPPVQSYNKQCAWQWTREHVLLPALRQFSPPCSMATSGCVLQIADLHELYKVFERC